MCADYSFPTFDDIEKDTQEEIGSEKMASTFFQTGNKGSEFTEAEPARWAGMQAVVSPGPNPLPAEVRLKYHPIHPDSFYGVSQEMWLPSPPRRKVYINNVQSKVRALIEEVAILTFAEFSYKFEKPPHIYVPNFNMPHEDKILEIIEIVDRRIQDKVSQETTDRMCQVYSKIGSGVIAEMCLNLTHTFRAGKNWNSHGGAVAATMCDIAGLITMLQTGNLPSSYQQRRIRGLPLGGARHGSHNTHYVEYMTSQYERKGFMETPQNYLVHPFFRRNKHADIVRRIFDEKLPGLDYPIPRPVRGHTVDFAATYMGTHVLDGECKDKAQEDGKEAGILVLHSLQQLTYMDRALALLTTSNFVTLYSSVINEANSRIETTYTKFPKYILGHPYFIDQDDLADPDRKPNGFFVENVNEGGPPTHVDVAPNGLIKTKWESLRSGPQQFLYMVFEVVDCLVDEFENTDLEKMLQYRRCSYNRGFTEPTFWSTTESTLQSRRCPDQNRFKYCSRTMEGNEVAQTDAAIHRAMYDSYKFMLETHEDEISDEVREVLEEGMKLHSPK